MSLQLFYHCPMNSICMINFRKNIFQWNICSVFPCSIRTRNVLPRSKHLSGPQWRSWEMQKAKAVLGKDLFLCTKPLLLVRVWALTNCLRFYCHLLIIILPLRPYSMLVFKEVMCRYWRISVCAWMHILCITQPLPSSTEFLSEWNGFRLSGCTGPFYWRWHETCLVTLIVS